MNNGRLEYIRNYYKEKQDKVKVEVPAQISHTTKGKVLHIFNGKRAGYTFKNGFAMVEPKDLYKFREYPHFKIHDKEGADNE